MPAPSTITARVEEIHAALLEAGWAGKRLPKKTMETYMARELGLSLSVTRYYFQTGERLGLWTFFDLPNSRSLVIQQRRPEEIHSPNVINATT